VLFTLDGFVVRVISDPPLIEPVEEVFADLQADAIYELIGAVLGKYRRTLQSDRRLLLEYFSLVQVARKVVGVGSVGTRAWISDGFISPLDLVEIGLMSPDEAQELHEMETSRAVGAR
jgi:hypothetical protein